MKKIALHNLGCKVNAYETEAMQQKFENAGYEIVDFSEKADIYIINTCTVTNIADRKSRQMLHKAKKQNPDAIVVAAGCYSQVASDTLENDDSVDIIVGNNRKNDIISIINEYESEKSVNDTVIDINSDVGYEDMQLATVTEHTRAYIKIQDGCNQFCTYCIIPYARGRIRSRNLESIMKEVDNLAKQGYREVVLTGIHLSSYGKDIKTEHISLLDVIKNIQENSDIDRIRLGSLEPGIITDEFAKQLSECSKICPHFHLSLQSGCDDTLKRMNRHYTSDEYFEKCNILRRYFENPAITTDVIVGFPGETEEEFDKTKQFASKTKFADMHIFKYSRRDGTKAAAMQNQVNDNIKSQRSNELINIAKCNSKKYRALFEGKQCEVLFEEKVVIDGTEYWTGYTKEYIKTAVISDENIENEMKKVKIISNLNEEIMLALL